MTNSNLYPCGRIQRRAFLHRAGGGFLGAALGAIWAEAGEIPDANLRGADRSATTSPRPSPIKGEGEGVGGLSGAGTLPAQAKTVIFLFMCGGVSHIDTFDPKDNKWAGKLIDVVGFGDNLAPMQRPVIPCHRTFTKSGKSGIQVSDWFPHVAGVIDEIAVVRSMWCHEGNHFPAVIETCTGHRGRQFDHPSFGSWIVHALGSANRNLPTFVNIGRPSCGRVSDVSML